MSKSTELRYKCRYISTYIKKNQNLKVTIIKSDLLALRKLLQLMHLHHMFPSRVTFLQIKFTVINHLMVYLLLDLSPPHGVPTSSLQSTMWFTYSQTRVNHMVYLHLDYSPPHHLPTPRLESPIWFTYSQTRVHHMMYLLLDLSPPHGLPTPRLESTTWFTYSQT